MRRRSDGSCRTSPCSRPACVRCARYPSTQPSAALDRWEQLCSVLLLWLRVTAHPGAACWGKSLWLRLCDRSALPQLGVQMVGMPCQPTCTLTDASRCVTHQTHSLGQGASPVSLESPRPVRKVLQPHQRVRDHAVHAAMALDCNLACAVQRREGDLARLLTVL